MADSGPRHYQRAEKLLRDAQYAKTETDRSKKLQEAQVHATLALVAATLQGGQGRRTTTPRMAELRTQALAAGHGRSQQISTRCPEAGSS